MSSFEQKYDMSRFEVLLKEEQVHQFNEEGYVILENFLGDEWATTLRQECVAMTASGGLKQHYFNFGEVKFEKPHVFEADLYDEDIRKMSAPLAHLYEEAAPKVVEALASFLPDIAVNSSSKSASVKLQFSHGGSFPYHYDNPGPPSRRQLTLIVYLNPDWQLGDGGELIIWPFLDGKVTVAPKMDRAVLFRSDKLLHRVTTSLSDRYCFTIWIDGDAVNAPEDTMLTRDHLQFESYDAAAFFFRSSPLQRVISRAVFAAEYEESLLECVGGTPGEVPMLRHHHANVDAMEKKLKPLIDALRERKSSLDFSRNKEYL